MNTKVVDVHVGCIRPTYSNLKEWIEDKNNVYIGRSGIVFVETETGKERYPKKNSIWANPFKSELSKKKGDPKPTEKEIRKEHRRIVKKYEKYIRERLEDEDDKVITIKALSKLKGKQLGCWCVGDDNNKKKKACHGDVLLKLVNEYL